MKMTEKEILSVQLIRYGTIIFDTENESEYFRVRIFVLDNKKYLLYQNCGNVIECKEI